MLQVCVLLPAFAAERRRACSTAYSARPQLSIDITCPQGAQQQTRWQPLMLSIDGTDRRTDAQPLHRLLSYNRRSMLPSEALMKTKREVPISALNHPCAFAVTKLVSSVKLDEA